jgi:hypothetical protein
MSPGDVYVGHASECQRLALSVEGETQKASWLVLADAWLRLAAWKNRRELPPDPATTEVCKRKLSLSSKHERFCVALRFNVGMCSDCRTAIQRMRDFIARRFVPARQCRSGFNFEPCAVGFSEMARSF